MPCYALEDVVSVVDPTAYVRSSAVLIGDVIVGPNCYVGPAPRCVGISGARPRVRCERTGHLRATRLPDRETLVAENGHIGHGAIVHSCTIGRDLLVGMNVVVMDDAEISAQSIVAACAFVPAGLKVPPRSLVTGVPGRIQRLLTDDEIAWKQAGTLAYQDLTRRSRRCLRETLPRSEIEPDRPRLKVPKIQALRTLKQRRESP